LGDRGVDRGVDGLDEMMASQVERIDITLGGGDHRIGRVVAAY
jgi:hypothetical protein